MICLTEHSRSINMITNSYIDALVQDCSHSIANALELLQPCTKPSIWDMPARMAAHLRLSTHYSPCYGQTIHALKTGMDWHL